MTFRISPILKALLATGSFSLAHAAVVASAPEAAGETRETRTLIVDGDAGAAEIVIAQSPPGAPRKEVKVITSGQHFDFAEFPDVDRVVSHAMAEAFSGSAAMPMARSVKNAPYSAEVISEKIQTLPDGNQITRKTSSMAWRDSAGRTRQETRDTRGEVRSIHIHDAVEGTRYVISPATQSATKLAIDRDLQKRIDVIKEKAKSMARDGKAHFIEHGKPGEEIIVKRVESPAADGKKEIREEVKVKVIRLGGDAGVPPDGPGAARLSGDRAYAYHMAFTDEWARPNLLTRAFQDGKWSSRATKTALGTKEIDGVRVEGKSVSYTIPAGEIGNRSPLTVSTETWTSPELQVTVYSKHSDPRTGDTVYRLANLKRGEPPASMFMVPEGYAVKESPAFDWKATK